jgi:hypothetical protein
VSEKGGCVSDFDGCENGCDRPRSALVPPLIPNKKKENKTS